MLQESEEFVASLLVLSLVQEEELLKNINKEDVPSCVASELEAVKVLLMEISDEVGIVLVLLFLGD